MSFLGKNQTKRYATVLLFVMALIMAVLLPLASASTLDIPDTDAVAATTQLKTSHRLIVQLESPALAELDSFSRTAVNKQNALASPSAQAYISQLQAEQATFINQVTRALPNAAVATYINENGNAVEATYQIVLNAVAIDVGTGNLASARKKLEAMPGVKAVFLDFAHESDLYASLPIINAQAAWDQVGGQANGGAGVKFASMDGGLHHDAAMFDGTGYSYPAGWPAGGLGDSANNNGKIIASRAYFRAWDPPALGDENTWPGTNGTSHGTHTGSTAVGNPVTANYLGLDESISGVAPAAWAMSYRVFYNSVSGDGSFYTVEGIAALEDIVADGANVLNNSWGGGPGSVGGEFDPLDQALINTYNAGVFVSMAAGNSGPGPGTGDHPSDEYINVAASTTGGALASGRLNITLPEPISATLQGLSYAPATFGDPLPVGTAVSYTYKTAISVNASNFEGCSAWPAGTFTGMAAVISRGSCEFGAKVLNAENAGATFVVIYNHASGGDSLVSMATGTSGDSVTIPSIFIGHTNGLGVVDWYDQHGAASTLEVDTHAFQAGNTADRIVDFSSRGPSAAMTLKPDIAAPGVNILAQGYAPGAAGEAQHLGYGQASGTSMASPHVAGAAVLLRQIHPSWTNAQIKSALMSTAKYTDVYNYDGRPAQPLDMGAGRLDLTHAYDPGVTLDPPSLSFGLVDKTGSATITVSVTSVATATETYTPSTLFTGNGFAITQTTTLTGFTIITTPITLNPGETKQFTVTFDAASSLGLGDNQGYVLLIGNNGHNAHMPAWARVTAAPGTADILIIQNDFSFLLGYPDYLSYYTQTLDTLGLTYDVYNADMYFTQPQSLPDMAELVKYKAIIYFTGDNYISNGYFTVATPLTGIDMDVLNEYANNGGILIAMGQDMAAVLASAVTDNGTFFYNSTLGGNWLQDSLTGNNLPTAPVTAYADAPADFGGVALSLRGHNENSADLLGTNAVPPVATLNYGIVDSSYDIVSNTLHYSVEITPTAPMTLTAAHIHSGTVGTNGPILFSIAPFTTSTLITTPYSFNGSVTLTDDQQAQMLAGGLYVNVHTAAIVSGELRGQIDAAVNGDGAGNQNYIDELKTVPYNEPDSPELAAAYTALLAYPGSNMEDGVVGMAHRNQPSLESQGVSYYGRSIYTSFGLEGVNDGLLGFTSRADLIGLFMDWAMDEPAVSITNISNTYTDTNQATVFSATLTSNITSTIGVSYRWDFGDGSPYAGPYTSDTAGHSYDVCGTYKVRVEATDSLGNVAVNWINVEATQGCTYVLYLPSIMRN